MCDHLTWFTKRFSWHDHCMRINIGQPRTTVLRRARSTGETKIGTERTRSPPCRWVSTVDRNLGPPGDSSQTLPAIERLAFRGQHLLPHKNMWQHPSANDVAVLKHRREFVLVRINLICAASSVAKHFLQCSGFHRAITYSHPPNLSRELLM